MACISILSNKLEVSPGLNWVHWPLALEWPVSSKGRLLPRGPWPHLLALPPSEPSPPDQAEGGLPMASLKSPLKSMLN